MALRPACNRKIVGSIPIIGLWTGTHLLVGLLLTVIIYDGVAKKRAIGEYNR